MEKRLTKREVEILRWVARGKKTTEIAAKLFISIATVETHRKNIIRKLRAKNMIDAISKVMLQSNVAI